MPALSEVTFLPPWVSVIVNPGPTVPTSTGDFVARLGGDGHDESRENGEHGDADAVQMNLLVG